MENEVVFFKKVTLLKTELHPLFPSIFSFGASDTAQFGC